MMIYINTNIASTAQGLILIQNFSLWMETFGKNVIISGADMSLSVHIDNKGNINF